MIDTPDSLTHFAGWQIFDGKAVMTSVAWDGTSAPTTTETWFELSEVPAFFGSLLEAISEAREEGELP